ncbi:hypothetical protein CEXT_117491 [Caerostris extrusa]|uniref:Uncharacterized protein n=1 Tax=Caerostris extrusa TaxID=172846 RepID=A0AAV4V9E7_CAEEX|nr:hypothetical protein CEXT_117491 [Caerostris extrusa]
MEPSQGVVKVVLLTVAAREGGARAILLFNDKSPPPFEEDILQRFWTCLRDGEKLKTCRLLLAGRQQKSVYSSKYETEHKAMSAISRKVDTAVKSPSIRLEWMYPLIYYFDRYYSLLQAMRHLTRKRSAESGSQQMVIYLPRTESGGGISWPLTGCSADDDRSPAIDS